MADALTDEKLVGVLQRYLTILQGHPPAEKMMEETLTDDFETGFEAAVRHPRPGAEPLATSS